MSGAPVGFRGNLRHEALLYTTDDEFVAGVLSFLKAGLDAGEPMLVALPAERFELLWKHIDGWSGVRLVDMAQLGKNPNRIIPTIRDFVEGYSGKRVRFVGEPIWPGRSAAEVAEATRYEALINFAFRDANTAILCPYDAAALDDHVLTDACRTHPIVCRQGVRSASREYADPLAFSGAEGWPLSPPPPTAIDVQFRFKEELAELRALVRTLAMFAGLSSKRRDDLVLAVSELATNTLRHTADGGRLTIWEEADSLICEVRDTGRVSDPLIGRHRPSSGYGGGRGLWLVNQVCDLVQIRCAGDGTRVRLHVCCLSPHELVASVS